MRDCIQNLPELGLTPSCLQTPTAEMCNTVAATGEQVLPNGYNDARFSYECEQAHSKLVVFKNIKTPCAACRRVAATKHRCNLLL